MMLLNALKPYSLILASQSPRRRYLMTEAGLEYNLAPSTDVEEVYPGNLSQFEIPVYLAELKSNAYPGDLAEKDILISADTIVWFRNEVINKPKDRNDAISILEKLSGNMHEVITGVCIRNSLRKSSFYAHSEVHFSALTAEEIEYYIEHFKPYDKAGAYGIQEWIGYIGIKAIKGSFYNVMGLPVQQLYHELADFIELELT